MSNNLSEVAKVTDILYLQAEKSLFIGLLVLFGAMALWTAVLDYRSAVTAFKRKLLLLGTALMALSLAKGFLMLYWLIGGLSYAAPDEWCQQGCSVLRNNYDAAALTLVDFYVKNRLTGLSPSLPLVTVSSYALSWLVLYCGSFLLLLSLFLRKWVNAGEKKIEEKLLQKFEPKNDTGRTPKMLKYWK